MIEEIQGLQQRLQEAEKHLEELKNSNREPIVQIVSESVVQMPRGLIDCA